MHECSDCGTACDCDGEDTWLGESDDHVCINPQCGDDGDEPMDDEP